MKIAVHSPISMPGGLARYLSSLMPILQTAGLQTLPYADAGAELEGTPDLLWDPCCGWSQGPVWPAFSGKVPRIITFHGAAALALPSEQYRGSLGEAIRRQKDVNQRFLHWVEALPSIDGVITPSQFGANEFASQFGWPDPKSLHIIPHGVDADKFFPAPKATNDMPSYFLHACFWQSKKNTHTVLKAYDLLPAKQRPPMVLIVPGFPDNEPLPLSSEAAAEILLIRSPLAAEELAPWYQGALALLFPSLHETFALPVLEAAACGCPAIISNGSALREHFADIAILIDGTDPSALANAMQRIMRDEKLRQKLAKSGLKKARRWTWQYSAQQHLRVFRHHASPNQSWAQRFARMLRINNTGNDHTPD